MDFLSRCGHEAQGDRAAEMRAGPRTVCTRARALNFSVDDHERSIRVVDIVAGQRNMCTVQHEIRGTFGYRE